VWPNSLINKSNDLLELLIRGSLVRDLNVMCVSAHAIEGGRARINVTVLGIANADSDCSRKLPSIQGEE
jgi:hypothetical protein